jgi:hypothetical protein
MRASNAGLFSGHKGESLFTEPLLIYFRHNPLPELFLKIQGMNDDRLLAITTALIVEERLDALLSSFLPKYPRLKKADGFTFAMKISLAEALALIPPEILRAASIIRKIRNEFAHQLEIDSFKQLKESLVDPLKSLRSDVYGVLGEDQRKPLGTLLEEYNAAAFFCIAGLDFYRENVAYLRSSIERPAFIESLVKQSRAENEAELQAAFAEAPVKVEIHNGQRTEVYPKGVVRHIVG